MTILSAKGLHRFWRNRGPPRVKPNRLQQWMVNVAADVAGARLQGVLFSKGVGTCFQFFGVMKSWAPCVCYLTAEPSSSPPAWHLGKLIRKPCAPSFGSTRRRKVHKPSSANRHPHADSTAWTSQKLQASLFPALPRHFRLPWES